jgi:hypothetical protein
VTAERGTSLDRPSPGVSALCRRFGWALPELLPRLRAGEATGDDLRREATLLFSRTHAGRIYVAEQARAMLASLAGIGAVEFPF